MLPKRAQSPADRIRALARLFVVAAFAIALGGPQSALPASAAPSTERAAPGASTADLLASAERHHAAGAYQDGLEAAEAALAQAKRSQNAAGVASALAVRGNLLLALGELERADRDLAEAMRRAEEAELPLLTASIQLNRGNLELARGQANAAQRDFNEAARLAESFGAAQLAAQAAANALRAQVSFAAPENPAEPAAQAAWRQVAQRVLALPDSRTKAVLAIQLAGTTERLASRMPEGDQRNELLQREHALLAAALEMADAQPSPRAAASIRAQALGQMGSAYALDGQVESGLSLTRRALLQSAQLDSETALFAWQLQAARLSARLGRPDEALEAYAAATAIIANHRGPLLRSLRLSFPGQAGETLTGIYREYVDLLLRRAQGTAAARGSNWEALRNQDLARAQAALEQLKGDELRDYFQDDCVIRYQEKLASVEEVAPDALVVYPFVLEDRLELLVSQGGALSQIVVEVDRDTLTQTVRQFRALLEKRTTRQYMRPARQIYDWVIRPIEPILERDAPETLVFVPDSLFRMIPMAALHDGKQFLIERYSLGLTPGLDLTDPSPINASESRSLFAGVSESVSGYSALPNVEREVDALHAVMGGEQLLNQAFSKRALTQMLENQSFGLVHIASHAQFDTDGGFVLAHDGPLSFDVFSEAVSQSKFRDQPLELLILSACETAEGDERAALGLSGLAIKAGARSALGSIWQVSDEATAEFMLQFYSSLREPGSSRAEAMRTAQRAILSQRVYRHPYFWAPFLMINSWL